jgi:hypothetical protein
MHDKCDKQPLNIEETLHQGWIAVPIDETPAGQAPPKPAPRDEAEYLIPGYAALQRAVIDTNRCHEKPTP